MNQILKITELKDLSIAYKCALEYDICPDVDEVDNILGDLVNCDKDYLKVILNKYSGWSCSDIERETFRKIDKL